MCDEIIDFYRANNIQGFRTSLETKAEQIDKCKSLTNINDRYKKYCVIPTITGNAKNRCDEYAATPDVVLYTKLAASSDNFLSKMPVLIDINPDTYKQIPEVSSDTGGLYSYKAINNFHVVTTSTNTGQPFYISHDNGGTWKASGPEATSSNASVVTSMAMINDEPSAFVAYDYNSLFYTINQTYLEDQSQLEFTLINFQ